MIYPYFDGLAVDFNEPVDDTPILVWIYEPGNRGKVYTALMPKSLLRKDGTTTYNGMECRWERLK